MITQENIQNYLNELTEAHNNIYAIQYPNLKPPVFTYTKGKKNIKVIRNNHSQKSVHCFIDALTGDLYKAASWKVPAKGIRGNILNANKPLLGIEFYR